MFKHMTGNRALLTNFMEKFLGTIVQICLLIIDSGCSKNMTGNCALLTNFVEKFLETVRFGNNDFAVIAGYGDVVIGPRSRLLKVYMLCSKRRWCRFAYRFMNYLEEQTDGEAMILSIKNGDQPLPCVTQVSIAGTSSTEQPPLKDKSMWSDQEKRIQKIDHLVRSLLIQGLPNNIYSLINSNKTAKDLWDALARHMLSSEYGEQDRKATVLYEYKTFKATEGELLLDTYTRYLQVINDLKKCGYSKDNSIYLASKVSHGSLEVSMFWHGSSQHIHHTHAEKQEMHLLLPSSEVNPFKLFKLDKV
nr:integrase, catalytic region, zinc finger, CCHC-type, peptidase aspartic, catalytic [Tanacetum cinerariifolium]